MTVEINRKKDQKTQNNGTNLEESLYTNLLSINNKLRPKCSIIPILKDSKEEKTLLRILGITVTFQEFSNKNNLLDLSFELKNIPFNELDSEFKMILNQEFSKTIRLVTKNSNKS